MYLGLLKFQVEVDELTQDSWNKDAKSLCEKLRMRFKVVAKTCDASDGEYAIAVTSLANEALALEQTFDKILAFSEGSGIGRVSDDLIFIDHLEAFYDNEE